MMEVYKNQLHPGFLTVCLNPTLQKTLLLESVTEGQVNRCSESFTDISGKGINVTRVLAQLGADAVHLTHAGGYSLDEFRYLAEKDNLKVKIVPDDSGVRCCYTVISRGNGTVTELVEQGKEVNKGTESAVTGEFMSLLDDSGFVIISGSKAPGYSGRIFPLMVEEAKKRDKFVILDYRGEDLVNSVKFRPDIINPNLKEFITTFLPEFSAVEESEDPGTLAAVKAEMTRLYEELGITSVLTNGKKEVIYTDGGEIKRLAPPVITPVNTIGSGDSFTAGLAWKLSMGESLENAVNFANICGSKNALLIKPGSIR